MKFFIGKKLGMTTLFDEKEGALNVTLIESLPNTVTLNRTLGKDGYQAIQVEVPKTKNKKVRQEIRLDGKRRKTTPEEIEKELAALPEKTKLALTQFAVGDKVNVSGITKAKGFQGVVKRHGFKGAPSSHGRKHDMRKPGSIGATFPEHVMKGRRMAGRMGGQNFTVRNLLVVYLNEAEGILGVRGAVPGTAGRLVKIVSVQ
jgi:large subunit ribosomal protein L3